MGSKALKKEVRLNLVPKTILFEKGRGFISNAIIEAQNILWKDSGKESQWSHIGFFGSDGKFYESTVKFSWKKIIYGIRVSKSSKILKEIIKHSEKIGIQSEFTHITDHEWDLITANAIDLKKAKATYGGLELVGTIITILRWKFSRDPDKRKRILREHNPFDNSTSMYCIAFVADCLKNAKVDYIEVEHSVSTVDHGWLSKLKHKSKIFTIKQIL